MSTESTPLTDGTPSTAHDSQHRLEPEPLPRARYRNDPTLVQRCLRGDESAWQELVERYARLVYSIPRRYGLSQTDAEDVFQNVFVIVLRELKRLRNQARLSAWLITITHHETFRLLKQHARSARGEEFRELPALEQNLQRFEQEEILRQALDRLEPTERAVITAWLSDAPPSYDELAEALKLPRGSIGYYRKRGLEHLRTHLQELGFAAEGFDRDAVKRAASS